MADFSNTNKPATNEADMLYVDTAETRHYNEQRYRAILQATMDGFCLTDTQGKLLDVNAAYCRITGYSAQELLARNITDLEAVDDEETIARRIQQMMDQGAVRFETRHRCKDGRLVDVEVSAQYLPLDGGRVFTFLRDISELKQARKALLETEQKLRNLTDHLPNALVYQVNVEPDGFRRFTFISRAVERLNEVGVEQVLADSEVIYGQLLPEYKEMVRHHEELALKHLTTFRAEVQARLPSGRLRWFELASTPRFQADGQLVWDGVQLDITDRKQAEEELQKLASIVRNSPELIAMATLDGTITFLNEAGFRMLGIETDELDGFNIARGTPDDLKGKVETEVLPALANQGRWVGELQCRNLKTGQLADLYTTAFTVNDPTIGAPLYIANVSVDITERKRAEHALRESEERFRTIFEQAHQGIVINSPSFAFEKANPAFCRMLGYTADEFLTMRFADITHPDHIDQDIENVTRLGQGKIPFYHTEKRYLHKNGQIIWADVVVSTIRDERSGVLRYYLTTINDISKRMQAEQEMAELEAQLQQAQKLESVGRLAGGVAHDFNNMLSIILGYAELAMTKVSDSESLQEDLKEIITAAERSAKVTRQLLAFARKQTVKPEILDLNRSITGIYKMLERIIGEQIHFEWHPGADLWPVKVDQAQVDQIMANLCVNARDAIHGKGKITIATGNTILDAQDCDAYPGSVPGEYVWIAVSDDGSGMDQYTQAHIFEPFFTTKGIGEGTGLGMAMVYGAVQQNRGFITVNSALDQGTTFTIYLPRYIGRSSQLAAKAAGDMPAAGRETILLVEDEPAVLSLTQKMLEAQGYTVLAANTAEQAVKLTAKYDKIIHLLTTDVIMPEMSGRDLWQTLSALRPEIKCLYMSGYPDNAIAHHGVLNTGVHFIQKPFSIKALSAKVRAALDAK